VRLLTVLQLTDFCALAKLSQNQSWCWLSALGLTDLILFYRARCKN